MNDCRVVNLLHAYRGICMPSVYEWLYDFRCYNINIYYGDEMHRDSFLFKKAFITKAY